ncbi:tyrosine-type recombinase/integrase [Sulfitobacter geojensis]|uniref:Tyrosine-type recombinase/integrase n=1 Tax=Sulfitobacter geojensis TaxID=1342299 RepID=A0AAE2W0P1_9RHOB|nr:tyrosine-type recombinase/integrase [Sulfitobacter geojensis]MBM1690786.1 tyrosine-type recombinase/integrase [Sulfitobacter geojensis]MBM1694852.1 tyrosine-type recombinase/integrase [Sulfitobacter geojensis]MBM1706994.1 tyrosine-type recombinase/integrase [Sulfitobacter geojensis]MBM1711052.1 tyrosine-type recombinase/integrase [Sulfitobacter geojensis]MBM1715118.1 tyrosine-type recombinase/integrase [Sulfitobacter geojensis]
MSRSYKGIKLKKNRVYSGADLQRIFSVSANTISNWVKGGLRASDGKRPYLFRGGQVMEFLKARRERAKTKPRFGEFKCGVCKAAVFAQVASLKIEPAKNGAKMGVGMCSECGGHIRKFVSEADLVVFERLRDPNTTVDSLYEGMRSDPGGIGICIKKLSHHWHGANDRTLYEWQFYAGHLAQQTIDQHLAAIRFFEDSLEGKSFEKLTIRDVDLVRSALKEAVSARGETRKSRSTVSHQASQIMAFLEWLIIQDGFKRLPQDLPNYIKMPKAIYAKALQSEEKAYPSIEEAEALLLGMPAATVAQRRSRAMVAIAYLGALRADTVTSLRICHFDVENRQILQDANVSRTKNGKSLRIDWFPIPDGFVAAVKEWIAVLDRAGLSGQDALFPSLRVLQHRKDLKSSNRTPIEPMASKDAVSKAFASACRDMVVKYSPHSVKDTLAVERDRKPLTERQRRAWSLNMGHDSEATTQKHYGTIGDDERAALFEEIGEAKVVAPRVLSDEAKIALVDRIVAELARQ